ncbi:MAG TPA: polysaccharide deacetylase family protein [Conexibacter sp.]|nr:polysaccharide deacetylase family protein [Conexibacter sp.]
MKGEVISLCYHGVSADWGSSLAVRPDGLRQQVAWFMSKGYRPVTVLEASRPPPGERLLAITFDDALRSVYRLALPLLDSLGAVATVYAPARPILDGTPMAWPEVAMHLDTKHAQELEGMTPDELRDVATHGWEVGSHTCTHPWLPACDDATLARELTESKTALEQLLGTPCRTLAYPFGAHDERVAAATAAAGYDAAVTLPARVPTWPRDPTPAERMTLPRIGIYWADDWHRFRLKVSRPLRLVRRTPLWEAAPRLRRALATRTPQA